MKERSLVVEYINLDRYGRTTTKFSTGTGIRILDLVPRYFEVQVEQRY